MATKKPRENVRRMKRFNYTMRDAQCKWAIFKNLISFLNFRSDGDLEFGAIYTYSIKTRILGRDTHVL